MKLKLFAAALLLSSTAVQADSLKLTPGMWETTMTMTNSMTGTQTTTTQECMVEDEFDPANMLQDGDNCELNDSNLDGNTLTFTLTCQVEGGGPATMTGVYTSNGDSGNGTMNMEMSFGGQTMTMQGEFEGRRIGDC